MDFIFNDGGRAEAGFKGTAGDCVCRAIAIATQKPYKEIYNLINKFAQYENKGTKKRGISSARNGVYKETIKNVMCWLGWKWIPTMAIGKGCTVHLDKAELPNGRIVVNLSKHTTAVIDGVVNDIYDPNDRGYTIVVKNGIQTFNGKAPARCVYGYFVKGTNDWTYEK